MVWLPTERLAIVGVVATPLTTDTGEPRFVTPSMNWTVPPWGVAGVVPPVFDETVAVNWTPWPKTDGLWLEVTAVVVSALTVRLAVTVWLSAIAVRRSPAALTAWRRRIGAGVAEQE